MKGIGDIARKTRRNLFGVGALTDDLRAQWDQAIASFQARRLELDNSETALYGVYELASADPADLAEWQRLMDSVIAKKTAMDSIAGAVTTVSDWFSSAMDYFPGLSGARAGGALGSTLGILPAFPITLGTISLLVAGAVAVVASVSSFVTYILAKRDRLSASASYVSQRTDDLVDAGMPVELAAEVAYEEAREIASAEAREDSGHSFGVSMERVALYIMIAAIASFVVPRVLARK